MGGGLLSRVAYSLYDHSILFNSLKDVTLNLSFAQSFCWDAHHMTSQDQNVRRFTEITSKISTQNMREVVVYIVVTKRCGLNLILLFGSFLL